MHLSLSLPFSVFSVPRLELAPLDYMSQGACYLFSEMVWLPEHISRCAQRQDGWVVLNLQNNGHSEWVYGWL